VHERIDDVCAGARLVTAFKACVVIPTYDNPATIERVVRAVHALHPHIVIVDDGSGPEAAGKIDALVTEGLIQLHRRAQNGGKGAAVKDGLRTARALGYSHALQVDADGQHALGDIPRFLAAAARDTQCLVLGQPKFDASIPAARLYGRRISIFWAAIESLGRVGDPLCGFRVYPIEPALAVNARGDRMDFDPEIIVRMVWAGVPVVKLETAVRYVAASEGGVSHFQGVRDNVRISLVHTRLVTELIVRAALALFGARTLRLAPARQERVS
jgi:glycosyltransferase involved in cell wall biosynthesis